MPNNIASIARRMVLIIIIAFPLPIFADGNLLVAGAGFQVQNVTPMVHYYVDQSNSLSLEQVQALPENAWVSAGTSALSFGYTSDTYWIKFKIENNSGQTLLLQADNPVFDELTLYRDEAGKVISQQSGLLIDPDVRPIIHREHLFPIPAGTKSNLLIKAYNSGSFYTSLNVWNEDAYFNHDANNMLLYGGYFGALATVVLLLLITYSVVRQAALISLAALTVSFGIYQLTLVGVFANELWFLEGVYRTAIIYSIGFSIISAYFLFSQALDLLKTSYSGELILRATALITLLAMLSVGFVGYQLATYFMAALAVVASIVTIGLSIRLSITGNRFAVYAAAGSFLLLLTTLQQALSRLHLLSPEFVIPNATFYGFLGMILILSIGVGSELKYRAKLTREQQRAEEEEEHLRRHQREQDLEHEVQKRTNELESALSDLSTAHESLKILNTVDQVTGTKNRYYFDTTFEQEWKRASREHYSISLLMVDIDYFKKVNDTYGHVVGDTCLRLVAERIGGNLKRPADVLARYGGEEFVVLLPYVENDNAMTLAEQIRLSVSSEPLRFEEYEIPIQLSIGVATVAPGLDDTPKDLITAADLALYEAKGAGRNQVRNAGELRVHTSDHGNKAG